ncbi:hemin ABC transporter substrate-binding protein [Devosia insulae DS-56]|uniref:Hemin ABC transporter substrate-binding protein n=1 Tax=Devosia insulae DS-56 TaxID=1116389 RepID=A0A1E5XIT8_9HYPH|nr:ABC transporter substrate-binding protein [Devosia insulae]OEO28513.1 hemin ABC transporter substrate-binding protein [Devosia insulae DS-56]
MISKAFSRLGGALAVLTLVLTPAMAEEVLRVPLSVDIGTFDPDNGFEIGAMSAIDNVYEGLVEYAPGSTEIVGQLAERWEVGADELSYTFHLRDGVSFHDGTPLDAAAVVQSFERRRTGELALSYFLGNVTDIAASDPATVVITLGHKQPSFIHVLASAWGPKVISPKVFAEHAGSDLAASWLNEHAVGTGPFTLTEFKRGEGYALKRNDAYWGAKPFFEEIRLPVVPDLSQQILQLQAGELDAVPDGYPVAQLAGLPATLEVSAAPNMTQFQIYTKPGTAMDDAAVRSAVLTAINPALWMKDIFGDYAELSKSLYQNAMLDPAVPVSFPTDLEAAKAAIAAHGPVQLRIGVQSEVVSYARIAELMVAQLATIGVKASVEVLPLGAAYVMKGDAKAPDMLLTIANPDAAHPESQAKTYFTTDAVLNFYGRSLPEADALVNEAGLMTDVAARDALYEQAGHMYFDAGYAIPLVDADDVVVHAKGLVDLGLRPAFPQGNIDYGTARWAP